MKISPLIKQNQW